MDKPTWRNTYNTDLNKWHGYIGYAFEAAKAAGYPFVSWNGRVYSVESDGIPERDTIVLTEQLT